MTTDYPRLPLVIAYLVDFARKSFGQEPKPTINLCEAFDTIFLGLFPVPSAPVARLLRFVFEGRFESKRVKKVGDVLLLSLLTVILVGSFFGMYLFILEQGWRAFLILILTIVGLVIGLLILLIAITMGGWLLSEYLKNRKAGRADVSGESVSAGREIFSTVAVVWHFIVAVKRHLCPIYANPLYREH